MGYGRERKKDWWIGKNNTHVHSKSSTQMARRCLKVTVKDQRRMSRNLLQHCGYTHNTAAPVVSDIKFFLDASVENAMVKGRDTGVPGLGAHIGRGYY